MNLGGLQPASTGFAPNSRPMPPTALTTSQMPNSAAAVGDPQQPGQGQLKSKAPVLETHLVHQLSRDEQDTLKSRHKDAEVAEKKVSE